MNKFISILLVLLLAFPVYAAFDGDGDDYVDLQDVATLDFGRFDDFSICFWLYMRSREFDALVSKQLTSGNFTGWFIGTEFSNNEELFFQLRNDNSPLNSYSVRTDEDSIPLNQWIHVCCTYNGSGVPGMNIYVDGVTQTLSTIENSGSGSIDNSVSVNIAARNDGNRPPNAIMEEVYFYDDELTAAEVLQLYNGPKRIGLQISSDQLVGYYPLDECATGKSCDSLTFRDLSSSGNDGTGVTGTGASGQVRSYP